MCEDKSFCYNKLFTEGLKDINTAEILLNERNPKSAFSYIKEAIEKYYTGYIFYKGYKAKNIHEIGELCREASACNGVLERFRLVCGAVRDYYDEDECLTLMVSKLDEVRAKEFLPLREIIKDTKELMGVVMMETKNNL